MKPKIDNKLNTSGSLRKEKINGIWFILGEGYIIPVKSKKEADELLKKIMLPISC